MPVASLNDTVPCSVPPRFSPDPDRVEIKIAYIGGGSREWAVKLMGDLALTDRLHGQLDLYDIDLEAALQNEQLSREIFSHPEARTSFRVTARKTLQEALKGADFVIISIEPGPIQLRHADLEIPARYGILQTVGDTTGPGGILRALRCVPIFRQFAREILEHCPRAWVINYTNPMAVCTAALHTEAPQLKVFGCCHEVFGTQQMLAEIVKRKTGRLPGRHEIELDLAGVNHFTWATGARWNGHDLFPEISSMISREDFFSSRQEKARQAKSNGDWFSHSGLVAYDLFRRFGALGAAGDRHLVEFVPWYLVSEEELHRWGVVLTPYSWRVERTRKPRLGLGNLRDGLQESGEEGVKQIEALLGLRTLTTNVNLPNTGQVPDVPKGSIVEGYAEFRKDSIRPLISDPLPLSALSFVQRAVHEQTLTLTAAIHCDRHLAFQALLTHPLVRLSTDKAWNMFGEMIEATQSMLPGWN
jgi:Alpha-galactosidases/6-phospho-beta-glucosidases, family 4 of glycosyl hydrolases